MKEMLQKSMETKRFNEGRRLVSSAIVFHMVISLFLLVVMLVLMRAIASSYLPFIVGLTVYEVFWMQMACFVVKAIWSDFTGRGLLLTFKETKSYLKTHVFFSYVITIPLLCLNVFVVPRIFDPPYFLMKDKMHRVW